MMALLASCGDTVYEAKGGAGGAAGGAATGTINISVKDGAGQTSFTKKADSVTVTLLNDPRNQGFPTSVLVDNGGVTFTGLPAGDYIVRVSKPEYASSFSETITLKNEQDYNERNQDYFILRTQSRTIDLFPLTAGLKGTLKYQRPDGKETGVAAGATVQIVINDERLADNREQQVTTGTDGSFTFSGLPATNNADYTIVALSKTFGDVIYTDAPVASTLALRPNVTQTLQTQTVYSTAVAALVISTSTISVTKDDEIEVVFSEELDVENLSGNNVSSVKIGTVDVPVLAPTWSGNKVTIKPKLEWKEIGSTNVTVSFSNVRAKNGKVLGSGSVTIAVLDGPFGVFKILNIVGATGSEQLILSDTTEPVVLIFSKELDESKIDGKNLQLLTQQHRTKIDGTRLELTPLGDVWNGVPQFTNAPSPLSKIFSVDNEAYAGATPTISIIEDIVDPFGLVSSPTIKLAVTDTLANITLKFSGDIDLEKTNGATLKVIYNLGATSTDADIKTAAASGYGGRRIIAGDSIVVSPTVKWDDDGGTGVINAIYFNKVFATNGKEASDVIVRVSRTEVKTFSYLPSVKQGRTPVASDSGEVTIWFDEALGDDIRPFVTISTEEPFLLAKTHGDSALSIKPLPGYIWFKAASGADKEFDIVLDEKLPSKTGGVLGTTKTVELKIGTSTGDFELSGSERVAWFVKDETVTENGDIAAVAGKIVLAWKRVPEATTYKLFVYPDLGKSPTEIPLDGYDFSDNSDGIYFTDGGVAVTPATAVGDTISIAVINPVVDAKNYRFVIIPAGSDGSLGDTASVFVSTRPTLNGYGNTSANPNLTFVDPSEIQVDATSINTDLIAAIKSDGSTMKSANFRFELTEALDLSTVNVSFKVSKGENGDATLASNVQKRLRNSISVVAISGNDKAYRIFIAPYDLGETNGVPNTNPVTGSDDLEDLVLEISVTGKSKLGGDIFVADYDQGVLTDSKDAITFVYVFE